MTRRLDVVGAVLLMVAVAMGVSLGLAAPDISPIFTEAPLVSGPRDGGGR